VYLRVRLASALLLTSTLCLNDPAAGFPQFPSYSTRWHGTGVHRGGTVADEEGHVVALA